MPVGKSAARQYPRLEQHHGSKTHGRLFPKHLSVISSDTGQETKSYKVCGKSKRTACVSRGRLLPASEAWASLVEAAGRGTLSCSPPQGWATKSAAQPELFIQRETTGPPSTDPQRSQGPSTACSGSSNQNKQKGSLNLKERVAGGPEIEQGSERW